MKILAYISCFVVSLSSSFAKTTKLWGRSAEGMTINEVLTLYPKAVQGNGTEYVTDYLGSKDLVTIERHLLPIDIFSYYKVRFWFNDDGLVKVGLESLSGSPKQRDELIRILTQKYGKPVTDETYYDLIRNEWYRNGLDIRFEYTNKEDAPHQIGVYYFRKTDRFLENEL